MKTETLEYRLKLMQAEQRRLEAECFKAQGAVQMLRALIQEKNAPQPEAATAQPQPAEVIEQKQE